MPWDLVTLNDGYRIPSIAFGTWKLGNGEDPIQQVDQAISVGFSHVDTAQAYRNEEEAGVAIRDSGLARNEIFITTKYSGLNGLGIPDSINNSLKNLGTSYVDLYLIHHPRLAPNIKASWKDMEKLKADGLVKSIGVSNFKVDDLEKLLADAKVKPAANQILLHPYVYEEQKPILEFCAKHSIVIEAYSSLIPITAFPDGPVAKLANKIAEKLGVTTDQVLFAWVKAKGAIVVTTSSKKSRLEGYLNAGDLKLTNDDIAALDAAGAAGAKQFRAKSFVYRAASAAFALAFGLAICSYLGFNIVP